MQRKLNKALMIYQTTGKVISTDPSGLEGDTTTWEYDLATGLELKKTYADGRGTVKTYDAYNNLATVTDARRVAATYSCDIPRGLLTVISFSDDTPAQKFSYNFLGQVVSVQDASGERSISYDHYGQTNEDVQPIAGANYALQEHWDAYGRRTGYALLKDGASQCDASTTYGALRDTRYPDKAIHHADAFTYDKRSEGRRLPEERYIPTLCKDARDEIISSELWSENVMLNTNLLK